MRPPLARLKSAGDKTQARRSTRAGFVLGAVPVGAAMALSVGLRLAATALATRLASVPDFGTYATVNAINGFVTVAAMGGWPSYLLATVPKSGVSKQFIRLMERRLTLSCFCVAIIQSLAIAFGLGNRVTPSTVGAAAVLLAGVAFGTVFNEAQRASGNIVPSRFALAIFPPTVTSIVIASVYLAGGAITSTALIAANAAGWAALWLNARLRIRSTYRDVQDSDAFKVSRMDLLLVKLSQAGLGSADIFAVGWLLGSVDGASYAVASRLATTVGFGYTAVVMRYGPLLSGVARDPQQLRDLILRMTRAGILISSPIAVFAAIERTRLLRLFGHSYAHSSSVALVLLIGVTANAVCGPISLAVNVNGQERLSRNVLVISCLLFFIALPPAALMFGPIGAAVSWTTITIGWNITLWIFADFGVRTRVT